MNMLDLLVDDIGTVSGFSMKPCCWAKKVKVSIIAVTCNFVAYSKLHFLFTAV